MVLGPSTAGLMSSFDINFHNLPSNVAFHFLSSIFVELDGTIHPQGAIVHLSLNFSRIFLWFALNSIT